MFTSRQAKGQSLFYSYPQDIQDIIRLQRNMIKRANKAGEFSIAITSDTLPNYDFELVSCPKIKNYWRTIGFSCRIETTEKNEQIFLIGWE